MPFDPNGCVSTLKNFGWIKWMYFCVNEFEVGVDDSIFSGNEQQKVYMISMTVIMMVWLWLWWCDCGICHCDYGGEIVISMVYL